MDFIRDFNFTGIMAETSLLFVFNGQIILVRENEEGISIPLKSDLDELDLKPSEVQYFGLLDESPCFTGEIVDQVVPGNGLTLKGIRSLFNVIDKKVLMVIGLANHLVLWQRNHKYCGNCGTPMEDKKDERAKECPKCGLINYPRISPAIIVAVLKGDQILLARSRRFPGGFYSVLAGYVEPGETLEECVRREVFEEVGIEVKNIQYFGNQPWPFPDSQMIAFTADYSSGDIKPDESEIVDAGWFSPDNLPEIPGKISIARSLIDWFLENRKSIP
jgi:NAD+ diphosphatase